MLLITENLCKGCGYCVKFCPKKILEFSTERNAKGFFYPVLIDSESCVMCGACATMCPDAAIELIEKEGESDV